MTGRRDFLANLKHLTGSLLTRQLLGDRADLTFLNLYNPSIGDFVLRRLASDIPQLRSSFLSLRSAGSLKTLSDLRRNGFIDSPVWLSVLRAILAEARQLDFAGFDAAYVSIALIELLDSGASLRDDQLLAGASLDFVLGEDVPTQFLEVAKLIGWGVDASLVTHELAYDFIFRACEAGPNASEFRLLSEMFDRLDPNYARREQVANQFKSKALDYLSDCAGEEFEVSDVFNGVEYGDIRDAERNARDLVSDWLGRIGVTATRSELDEIVNAFDVCEFSFIVSFFALRMS